MASANFRAALRALHDRSVEFIIVGGVASVLHGAPLGTFDVDVIPASGSGNRAETQRLSGTFDCLDILETKRGLTYEDLLPHTTEMDIGEGICVRVLDLETIIAIKEELRSEKDLAVLPLLRRTLQEQRRRS